MAAGCCDVFCDVCVMSSVTLTVSSLVVTSGYIQPSTTLFCLLLTDYIVIEKVTSGYIQPSTTLFCLLLTDYIVIEKVENLREY
jgi:hypothetical protein